MDMEKLVRVVPRRGFIFQSSEILRRHQWLLDYGPLGVELKKNIKDAWWHDMVRNPPPGPDGQEIQMVGVDCSIIMNPKVWEASGHVGGFADLMIDCRACKAHLRADQITASMYVQKNSTLLIKNRLLILRPSRRRRSQKAKHQSNQETRRNRLPLP